MSMEKRIKKSEIGNVCEELITIADTVISPGATIITLSGDLGAGKTTLTQEVARRLGVIGEITSPTFVIMKRYEINHTHFKNLIHIDAYRLNSDAELLTLGFQEISENKDNLIFIEWPERVPACTQNSACQVFLSHVDEEARFIEIVV